MAAELPELIVADAVAWRALLGEHHDGPAGARLVLARKGTSEPTSLTYDQALEEARIAQFVATLARGETI